MNCFFGIQDYGFFSKSFDSSLFSCMIRPVNCSMLHMWTNIFIENAGTTFVLHSFELYKQPTPHLDTCTTPFQSTNSSKKQVF